MTKQPGDTLDAQVASITNRPLPMNGAEKRKVNRLLARAVALELLREGNDRLRQIDVELMPTERILERWAVSIGDGLPGETWDESRKTRLSPLPELVAILVDQFILRAPVRYSTLARRWYCGHGATVTIARDFGVTNNGLYLEWRAMLMYFKRCFELSGNRELAELVERLD